MENMNKIRELRLEQGLSQAKLAARAELDPSTVNQIERGVRDAAPLTLRKIAQALGVSFAELLEETDSPKDQRRSSREPSFNGLLEEERQATAFIRVIKALRTYFWDMRLRWNEPGNRPKPSQIRDALELLQHLIDKGAFEGSWTPDEQVEVQLLFQAANKLKPIAEEMATTEEVEDLRPKADAVFDDIEARLERIGTP
jgi:transcriptional regulator with XRE-family HTH domain